MQPQLPIWKQGREAQLKAIFSAINASPTQILADGNRWANRHEPGICTGITAAWLYEAHQQTRSYPTENRILRRRLSVESRIAHTNLSRTEQLVKPWGRVGNHGRTFNKMCEDGELVNAGLLLNIEKIPGADGVGHALGVYFNNKGEVVLYDSDVGIYKFDRNGFNWSKIEAYVKAAYGPDCSLEVIGSWGRHQQDNYFLKGWDDLARYTSSITEVGQKYAADASGLKVKIPTGEVSTQTAADLKEAYQARAERELQARHQQPVPPPQQPAAQSPSHNGQQQFPRWTSQHAIGSLDTSEKSPSAKATEVNDEVIASRHI